MCKIWLYMYKQSIHTCMYIHRNTHTQIHTNTPTHTGIHISTHTRAHTHTHTQTHTHTDTHTHTHTHTQATGAAGSIRIVSNVFYKFPEISHSTVWFIILSSLTNAVSLAFRLSHSHTHIHTHTHTHLDSIDLLTDTANPILFPFIELDFIHVLFIFYLYNQF